MNKIIISNRSKYLSKRLIRIWRIIWAIVTKDLQDIYRFKFFITTRFFTPLLNMFSFYLVYAAVFLHVNSIGFMQKSNYVIYLVTGFLAYNFFRMAWNSTRLNQEKYTLTLEGTLLAPVSRIYILVGKAVRAFIELSIDSIMFGILLIILRPSVNWIMFFQAVIGLLSLYFIWVSIDFIISGIQLSQEGIAGVLSEYIPRGVMLISAVYYPIESLPQIFKYLSLANPVYHAVILFRSAFIPTKGVISTELSLAYLIILGCTLPFLSVKIFDGIYKKFGIKGY